MEWIYKGNSVTTLPENAVGFTYCIINNQTQKQYIGKKQLYSHTTKKVPGRKNRKHTIKESNWRDYYGSNDTLLEEIAVLGEENFTREILQFYNSKKNLTYAEVELQFKLDVLYAKFPDGTKKFYNQNILGKFFPEKEN